MDILTLFVYNINYIQDITGYKSPPPSQAQISKLYYLITTQNNIKFEM